MAKRWAITDIHGCAKTFRKLVEDRVQLGKEDELFLLGDYIDRGPDSRGVFDYIFHLMDEGYQVQCLRGNHEDILLNNLDDLSMRNGWFYNGGLYTLQSFNTYEPEQIPQNYVDFINKLDYHIITHNQVLVHAGLNFETDDPFADRYAMMWIRNKPVYPGKIPQERVIHGHTPIVFHEVMEQFEQDSFTIDLDNGCVYKDVRGMGSLLALDLDRLHLEVQENIDNF